MADERKGTAVRLPAGLLDRLDAVCAERVVSRNLVITRALERFLDDLAPLSGALASGAEPNAGDSGGDGTCTGGER